jgi:hypothetical protein
VFSGRNHEVFHNNTAAVLAATTSTATAGNLDRSGRNDSSLVREDAISNSFPGYQASSGVDAAAFGGLERSDNAPTATQVGLAYKQQFNEQFSFADHRPGPTSSIQPPPWWIGYVGGTVAVLDTVAFTGIAR